jgi:hypothetical protein
MLAVLSFAISTMLVAGPARADEVNAEAAVAAHNEWRARDGVADIRWSPALQRKAQQWANNLRDTRDCGLEHGSTGENLFTAGPLQTANRRDEQGNWIWQNSLQEVTVKDVVDAWGDEKQWYDPENNACNAPPGQSCGHYTQVVWRASTEVGCARAVCDDFSQVWVCNYSPAGNVTGERPF